MDRTYRHIDDKSSPHSISVKTCLASHYGPIEEIRSSGDNISAYFAYNLLKGANGIWQLDPLKSI